MAFKIPNERQAELCRACGIEPEEMVIKLENDSILVMLHLKSGNDVWIDKGPEQRRREKEDRQRYGNY